MLPVGLTGTKLFFLALRRLHRTEMFVTTNKLLGLPRAEGRAARQRVAEVADQLIQRIANLLPLMHQGAWM